MNIDIHTEHKKTAFLSHGMKVCLLWFLFVMALMGTYILSHSIELRSMNYAAVFLVNGSKRDIRIYADKAEPITIEANQGDEIVFTIMDSSKHNIAEERNQRKEARLESGEIGKNESYSLVFQKSGTFSFYDRMNQDIHVSVTIR